MRLLYFAIIFSLAASPILAAEAPLTAADIKQQVIGKSWSSTTAKGKPFTVIWRPNGSGTMNIRGVGELAAKWQLKGDQLCWSVEGMASPECSKLTASGSKLMFKDAATGKVTNVFSAAK